MGQAELAASFDAHRPRLHAVAYRVLGSPAEADDAVQETWLRLARVDADQVANLQGWLTTVVARVALDMLRRRSSRREEPFDAGLPDPVVVAEGRGDRAPEEAALAADAVSAALLVVLETLAPTERLVFVLHDLFAVPFDEIGRIVGRSTGAAKQMASRARARVRDRVPPTAPPDRGRHRAVVAAFLQAAREGDLQGLLAVLDPEVTLRVDRGPAASGPRTLEFRDADTVAAQALSFARFAPLARPASVNGAPGLVTVVDGEVFSVQAFAVRGGRITEIDLWADPRRLRLLPVDVGQWAP